MTADNTHPTDGAAMLAAAILNLATAITDLTATIRTTTRPANPPAPPEPSTPGWAVTFPDRRPPVPFPVEADARAYADRHGGTVIPPRVPVLDPRRLQPDADGWAA